MSGEPTGQPVVVRRMGSNVAHVAIDVPVFEASHLGAPVLVVATPVAAICGAILRGDAIMMPAWNNWDRCRPCEIVASYRGYTISEGKPRAGAKVAGDE